MQLVLNKRMVVCEQSSYLSLVSSGASFFFFFLNDPPPPEIYPFPLHAPLPIYSWQAVNNFDSGAGDPPAAWRDSLGNVVVDLAKAPGALDNPPAGPIRGESATEASGQSPTLLGLDRKSTRLNSSHSQISYAVFC